MADVGACVHACCRPSQGVGRKIACRTRYFDDFLLDCSSSPTPHGDIRLFYILGAGMDTRAWRLGLNGTVVEVDTADVIGAKEVLLQRHTGQGQGKVGLKASGGRVGVAADLGTQQWLGVVRQKAEGGPGQGPPVSVVMEGLTMYLNGSQVSQGIRRGRQVCLSLQGLRLRMRGGRCVWCTGGGADG